MVRRDSSASRLGWSATAFASLVTCSTSTACVSGAPWPTPETTDFHAAVEPASPQGPQPTEPGTVLYWSRTVPPWPSRRIGLVRASTPNSFDSDVGAWGQTWLNLMNRAQSQGCAALADVRVTSSGPTRSQGTDYHWSVVADCFVRDAGR